MSKSKKNPFYSKVKSLKRLRNSWRKVYQNGIQSKSEETRKSVNEFSLNSENNLNNIYRKLHYQKWKFDPADGIPIRRPPKKPRPIVISSIPNRIVQRSILDVIQEEPNIETFYKVDTSFGGIKKRGVRDAIEAAYGAVLSGAEYYIRSDIMEFFVKIPRDYVLQIISNLIKDDLFNDLLKEATQTELKNLDSIQQFSDLFPLYEIGVAQGCCLSPIIGNILLYEFDKEMNRCEIICLRYIDDFLILGADASKVHAAFKKAKSLLNKHGLTAYDPNVDTTKAQMGYTKRGFEFLGCKVIRGLVSPNKKSRKRLLSNVDEIIKKSVNLMSNPEKLRDEKKTLSETLSHMNNVIRGWGNQYSFCNNLQIMQDLDSKIDDRLNHYLGHYRRRVKKLDAQNLQKNRRRLLGVHLLEDSNYNPIIK